MKKYLLVFFGLLITAVVALVIKARQWVNEIEYGMAEGFEILNRSAKGIDMRMPMWIYNPTPFNVIVSKTYLRVYFDNYYMSTIETNSNFQLSSKKNSVLPLIVQVAPKHILRYLSDRGTVINDPNWKKKVKVTVTGRISIELGVFSLRNIPVNFTESLKYYTG